MRHHNYYVYLMSSIAGVFYIGMTNDLERRIAEHKARKDLRSFTARYNVTRLVYFEEFGDVSQAINREKVLKKATRANKIKLIESTNPGWCDLTAGSESAIDSSRARQKDARE